uniref:Uncharacterized protein n=1 Tax=Heterorhabditis bacteriophora TaxID=37862 RepID=A0A1I7WHJ2_HETBA
MFSKLRLLFLGFDFFKIIFFPYEPLLTNLKTTCELGKMRRLEPFTVLLWRGDYGIWVLLFAFFYVQLSKAFGNLYLLAVNRT